MPEVSSRLGVIISKIEMKSKREKARCITCNKIVEVVNLIPHEDYDDQIFSCGQC